MNPPPPIASRLTRHRAFDRAVGIGGALASSVTLLVLAWIIWDLIRLGLPHLSWQFLTGEVESSGREGGIGPILASTVLILISCLIVAVPLGIGCAVWLTEYVPRDHRLARLVSGAVDLLASIPSIVFGLFGMTFFCQILGMGYSILSGGLTLACMILPILIRTSMAAMSSVPDDLRRASAALGMTKASTLVKILLPSAAPGILVGLTLGIGRALAETAALIFTSGYATRWPSSLHDSGRSISVHIYDLAMNIPDGAANAAASALILLVLLFIINLTASTMADRWIRRHIDP